MKSHQEVPFSESSDFAGAFALVFVLVVFFGIPGLIILIDRLIF